MNNPEALIRAEIRALSAYHVPSSAGLVKLDAMENPYRLPAPLQAQLAAVMARAPLNRYPDAAAADLKGALRKALRIPDAAEILVGNGSDEIIQIIAMAVAKPGAKLLSVEPAFVMFRMIATFCGLEYVGVPLRADFALDEPAMLAALERHRPAVTFIAYPNNPTGNLFDAAAIERIAAAAPGLVVIDEAYFAFAAHSFLDRFMAFPNVVLMRTVSKLGMAGLRLGMVAGSPAWIAEFDKVRLPYNVNSLTQAVAALCLENYAVLQDQAARIISERVRLETALRAFADVVVYPSEANFVLIRVRDADAAFAGLLARGILIKNVSASHPLLKNCLRVTVGSPEENTAFLTALAESEATVAQAP